MNEREYAHALADILDDAIGEAVPSLTKSKRARIRDAIGPQVLALRAEDLLPLQEVDYVVRRELLELRHRLDLLGEYHQELHRWMARGMVAGARPPAPEELAAEPPEAGR